MNIRGLVTRRENKNKDEFFAERRKQFGNKVWGRLSESIEWHDRVVWEKIYYKIMDCRSFKYFINICHKI